MSSSKNIVSIISGKGGSGKTSISLALAQLLAMLDQKALLIDLDVSTHGASYFFEPTPPGLIEIIEARRESQLHAGSLMMCIRKVSSPCFDFLPSKTNFSRQPHVDGFASYDLDLVGALINGVVDGSDYDYIIVDCQAGVNLLTNSILSRSSSAIIVTEADSVSTKALRNLQVEYSQSLPGKTRVLINKLFLEERSTYDQLTSVLRGLEFLPPVPFDMEVREAFARNIIPLAGHSPSAYFSAILRIAKDIFPELSGRIEEKTRELKEVAFLDYEKELSYLARKAEDLSQTKDALVRQAEGRKRRVELLRTIYVSFLLLTVGIIPYVLNISGVNPRILIERWDLLWAVSAVSFAYAYFVRRFLLIKQWMQKDAQEKQLPSIEGELEAVLAQMDKYKTLYLTERKKLFL